MRNKIIAGVLGVGALIAASFGYEAASQPAPAPSDVNEDGTVNLQDVSIVLSDIASTSAVISAPATTTE